MASSEGTKTAVATATASPATATASKPAGQKRDRQHRPAPESSSAEAVEINCLMNARYHSARESFLDAVHRWLMLLIIISGAGAVLALLPERSFWPTVLSAAAAVMAALDLTFDLSNRARAHALMRRRYFELLADLRDGVKTVAQAEACCHRFSADEEPAYHALLMGSWNAAQRALYGDGAELLWIPHRHRWLQHLKHYEGRDYPPLGSQPLSLRQKLSRFLLRRNGLHQSADR